MLVLDSDGRVVSASPRLRAMLAGSDGLRLNERGLAAITPADQARLDGMVRAALRPQDGIARDGRLSIARPAVGSH